MAANGALVRITKKHTRGFLVVMPHWLSNGHWLIRRSFVQNADALAASPEAKRQRDSVARDVAKGCEFARPWLLDFIGPVEWLAPECAILRREAGKPDDRCYIDAVYWRMLLPIIERSAIVGRGRDKVVCFVDERGRALAGVMPMKAW